MKKILFGLLLSLSFLSCEEEVFTGNVVVNVENGPGYVGIFDPSVLLQENTIYFREENALRISGYITSTATFEGLNPGNYVCAGINTGGNFSNYASFQITPGGTVEVDFTFP